MVLNYMMMYCIKLSLPENKGCLPMLHFDSSPKRIAQFEIEVAKWQNMLNNIAADNQFLRVEIVFDEIYGSSFSTLWPWGILISRPFELR
jgi:hypothetical protein